MKIEERLIRKREEDIIEIGRILERFYNGQAGIVIRSLINGLISTERVNHQYNLDIPADRVLGRLEAYQNVIDKIELGIQEMRQLTEEAQKGGDNNEG